MQSGLIVLMLSLLGLQPITTDLYLPALPALTADFGASMAWFSWRIASLAVAIFGAICLVSGAIGPFPQAAGAASAMNGFFMMVLGIWFWGGLIALTARTLLQKYGAIDGH